MGFTELVKNLLLGGGSSIKSGDYFNPNDDNSDEETIQAEENPNFDEYDVFGEDIAAKVRMIEFPEVKYRVLHDVESMVYDAFLGEGIYAPITRKLRRSKKFIKSNCEASSSSSTSASSSSSTSTDKAISESEDDENQPTTSNQDNEIEPRKVVPYY